MLVLFVLLGIERIYYIVESAMEPWGKPNCIFNENVISSMFCYSTNLSPYCAILNCGIRCDQ